MGKIRLKQYSLRDDIFDAILYEYAGDVFEVPSLKPYIHGYCGDMCKDMIAHCTGFVINPEDPQSKNNSIVCKYNKFVKIANKVLGKNIYKRDDRVWLQCIFNRAEDTNVVLEEEVSGTTAFNYIYNIIKKYYTDDEIKRIFWSHSAEEDEEKKQYQYHILRGRDGSYKIHKYDNCYKYDINGAHTDAIIALFPKAKDELLELYKQRKQNPKIKKYFNYFVGYLCCMGYRKTYNWIVQRTTDKLFEAIDYLDGQVIYANTDGVCVQNPSKLIEHSTELGKFKLEYEGTVYAIKTPETGDYTPYTLTQFGDELKGVGVPMGVRSKIDLSRNKYVLYKLEYETININGESVTLQKITNIKEINDNE